MIIEAEKINKSYTSKRKVKGSLRKEKVRFQALKDINLRIMSGEFVGIIGPNGAGKSTLIKIMSGILTPSSGDLIVKGIKPYDERQKNAENISAVFGQRTQLRWDIPVIDSMKLNRKIYQIPQKQFDVNFTKLVKAFDVENLLSVPVRKLSLGQKMKCEILASLLHNPKIIYLDEPTIGLDMISKRQIRDFIKKMNKEQGTTIVLTSHDMQDIENLCDRLVIINHGQIIFDGSINDLKSKYLNAKEIHVQFYEPVNQMNLSLPIESIRAEGTQKLIISFNPTSCTSAQIIREVLDNYSVADIQIHEESIESIIEKIYIKEDD
ncbi:ABC transporter ATP-binding protein NatA [Listeria monocytogenes]|uniref:ABC transporter ATP-binding protein n=1 Tax=Listeria monocytogenes TaxID=1639 RepID=UPI000E708DB9|nr:ATP-binding cassette domain-containing protein [Listeria monocytogenes]RKA27971.1 ABC transporter ATP-binding protein NatA [Listeria monocytogenes]